MMKLHGKCVQRGIVCTAMCGFLLATSSSVAWAQSTPKNRLQLETAACKLISIPPKPSSGGSEAISVPDSTLSALTKTGNKSLESVVRAYDKAARAQNTDAMIRALTNGVKVCHRLGLRTAA